MKLRITDIPPEGLALDFEIAAEHLAARIEQAGAVATKSGAVPPPSYEVTCPPKCELKLHLEGSSVFIDGRSEAMLQTVCARCAEEAKLRLSVPVKLTLKPKSRKHVIGANDEGLEFGVYDGEEINCSDIVEEYLVLALPFTVLCSDTCQGLCPGCGANLNREKCRCREKEEPAAESPFSVLRNLKIQ